MINQATAAMMVSASLFLLVLVVILKGADHVIFRRGK